MHYYASSTRWSSTMRGGRVGGEGKVVRGIPPPCSLPTATFQRRSLSPKKSDVHIFPLSYVLSKNFAPPGPTSNCELT